MNDVMSGGLHRWWKDEFVRRLGPFAAGPGTRVLDVAGGTGDTAFRIADLLCSQGVGPDEVDGITVCDINADMLAEGKRRYETGTVWCCHACRWLIEARLEYITRRPTRHHHQPSVGQALTAAACSTCGLGWTSCREMLRACL